jgi:diguanylate cyclase (GGDEF)-like protein
MLEEQGIIRTQEIQLQRHDGSCVWIEHNSRVVRNDSNGILWYEGSVSDISGRKSTEAELHYVANHDSLTSHYNRHYFSTRSGQWIDEAQRYGHPFSIMITDVDGLSTINDHFGHLTGDRCLQKIASFLGDSVRGSDEVIRWGGDEFLICMPNTKIEEAQIVEKRIRQSVLQGELAGEKHLMFELSIGIATWQPGESLEDVLRAADMLMYDEKRNKSRIHQ